MKIAEEKFASHDKWQAEQWTHEKTAKLKKRAATCCRCGASFEDYFPGELCGPCATPLEEYALRVWKKRFNPMVGMRREPCYSDGEDWWIAALASDVEGEQFYVGYGKDRAEAIENAFKLMAYGRELRDERQ